MEKGRHRVRVILSEIEWKGMEKACQGRVK